MNPNTFWNTNNGKRDVLGVFAESNYKWSDKLISNIGARVSMVTMDAGNISGYNNGTPAPYTTAKNDPLDANAFNALDRSKKDIDLDITAAAEYKNSAANDLELGFARKTRSPNIHERYTWAGGYGSIVNGAYSTGYGAPIAMDMAMINWFGDGNGYVGNINLKPEVANTVSASSVWHDEKRRDYNIKITPYYTMVKDYIDVDKLATEAFGGRMIQLFQFANHDAVLFGADLSADAKAWESDSFGRGTIKTVAGYTRGYRTDDSGSGLYHMMPIHAKVSVEQEIGSWTNGIDVQAVANKTEVDNNRKEPTTPGYALVDLRTNYKWSKMVKIDFAITNLLDKQYDLPLGGVNLLTTPSTATAPYYSGQFYSIYSGQFYSMAGQGRSFNTAITVKF
jgi:iron complex outermembrane receptor protein